MKLFTSILGALAVFAFPVIAQEAINPYDTTIPEYYQGPISDLSECYVDQDGFPECKLPKPLYCMPIKFMGDYLEEREMFPPVPPSTGTDRDTGQQVTVLPLATIEKTSSGLFPYLEFWAVYNDNPEEICLGGVSGVLLHEPA